MYFFTTGYLETRRTAGLSSALGYPVLLYSANRS
jgi:hypothetical protein